MESEEFLNRMVKAFGKLEHRKNCREIISKGDMLNHVHFIAVCEREDLIN